MKPTTAELTAAAKLIVQLDVNGKVANWQAASAALIAQYDVSAQRASQAVASAARRLRHAQLAAEGASNYTLRIRLSEAQHELALRLAHQETGGNVSELFRQRTLGQELSLSSN